MSTSGHRAAGAHARTSADADMGIRTGTLTGLLVPFRHHRLDRETLILCTGGHGTVDIDFRGHPCRPGTLVRLGPGQVIRYDGSAGLDAVVIDWSALIPTAPGLTDTGVGRCGHWQLTGEDQDAVINEVSQLVVDCRRHGGGVMAGPLLRHQLAVVLLRLALLDRRSSGSAETTYQRLCREVEGSYRQTRRVEDYAWRLGCSVRTLTRACLVATGRSAKQVVDARVALEAMRLLATSDIPIADLGRQLGFPEPTNFGRFFAREVGLSPGTFRARNTGNSTTDPVPGPAPEIGAPGAADRFPLVRRSGRPGGPATGLTVR